MARPTIEQKFVKDLVQGDQILAINGAYNYHGLARREDESLYVWYFVVEDIDQMEATESYQITLLPHFSDDDPGVDPSITTFNGATVCEVAVGDMTDLLN
jgi:hypothetical protein